MRSVLIVDDNQDNLTTLELLVEGMPDISVSTAYNGAEAVEAVKNGSIDLVLMDIMMPVMDGIEATRQIRQFNKQVMIVAISALDDERSKNTMIRNGCEDYITKPIEETVFKRRMKNYFELLDLRHTFQPDELAVNLFTKEVSNRSVQFRVRNKTALAEFWEFYLADTDKSVDHLSDCVRIIYALSSFILETRNTLTILAEENSTHLFFTMTFGAATIGEGVVRSILQKHYPKGRFVIREEMISFMLDKIPLKQPDELAAEQRSEDEKILRKTHENKTHARDYVENTPINIVGRLEDMEAQEDEIDSKIIEFEARLADDVLHEVGELYLRYALVIEELVEFQHLAYAIESLAKLLKESTVETLTEKQQKTLTTMLLNILEDLSNWRKTIFILREAQDIHYLDASLLSSCMQTEMVLNTEEKPAEDDDAGIEFF